jgi:hypothetical protein
MPDQVEFIELSNSNKFTLAVTQLLGDFPINRYSPLPKKWKGSKEKCFYMQISLFWGVHQTPVFSYFLVNERVNLSFVLCVHFFFPKPEEYPRKTSAPNECIP